MTTIKHPSSKSVPNPLFQDNSAKSRVVVDFPDTAEKFVEYSKNTVAIHAAIKIGLGLESRKQLLSGNLYADYQLLYQLLDKTFVVDENKHLTLKEYHDLLKGKQAQIENKIRALRAEKTDEKYIQELEKYSQHLNDYIDFIDQYHAGLLNKLQQLKKIFIQDAVLNPILQQVFNAHPEVLPDNPSYLLAKINKFNDALYDDASFNEIFADSGLKLSEAEIIQSKQHYTAMRNVAEGEKAQPTAESNDYDHMPVDAANYPDYLIQLHRDAYELRKFHNHLKVFKSLTEWNQQFSALESAHRKVNALYAQIQENSGLYSEYDRARISDLKSLFDSYQKSNVRRVKASLTALAKKITENKLTVEESNERVASLKQELAELQNKIHEWSESNDKLVEKRYIFVSEINKKKLEILQLIELQKTVYKYSQIDLQQIDYLNVSKDEDNLLNVAMLNISKHDHTNDQAKIAELQSHLVSLDHLQHQIIHENADSKALYELTSDQKIHFIQDEGLIVKDRQHSLVTLGHESEASLKAFNHYLNLIEVSIGRQQPDFELFTKLVTSTWGRKILQKAESLDKNKALWQRTNNIYTGIINLWVTNALAAEGNIFKKIPPERFLIPADKRDPVLDADAATLSNYSVNLTNHVIEHLLQQRSPEALVFILEHYIWMMHKCRQAGAYNSMMAIAVGIHWSPKLLSPIKHCLSDDAKKLLQEYEELTFIRNGLLKNEMDHREDAVPYSPCYLSHQATLEGVDFVTAGSSQEKQSAVKFLDLFRRQQNHMEFHDIRLAEFNLLVTKPASEDYSVLTKQLNSLFERGVVTPTPVMSDIHVAPHHLESHVFDDYYHSDAALEKYRILELDKKMAELYAEIAKINLVINEKNKAIVEFLNNVSNVNFERISGELGLAIEVNSLDAFITRYAKHKSMLVEIKLLAENYDEIIAKIKVSSVYQDIIRYNHAQFKENEGLYSQYIKKWRNMLVNSNAGAVDISPAAAEQLVSEKRHKIAKINQKFQNVEEGISYISQIKNARKLQKELEDEFITLMINNLENVDRLKALAAIRNYQKDEIVLDSVSPVLAGTRGVQEFIRKSLELRKQLKILDSIKPNDEFEQTNLLRLRRQDLIEDKNKIIEHERLVAQEIERFEYISNPVLYKYLLQEAQKGNVVSSEKEDQLSNLDKLLNVRTTTDNTIEYALKDIFGSFPVAELIQEHRAYEQNMQKLAESQHKDFLLDYNADSNSIQALRKSYDNKKIAFLNYAAKMNLNLIYFVAQLEHGKISGDELFQKFCASYPEPSPTEQRKFKDLLHLRDAIAEKLHLLHVYVKNQPDDNEYKNDKLVIIEGIQNLYETNALQLSSLIEADNPIEMKQFLEYQITIDPSQVNAEKERRAQLSNIESYILRQIFMSKPDITLSDNQIHALNSLVVNPAATLMGFNKVLHELPGKVSLSLKIFNQIRHQAFTQDHHEGLNINDLLRNLVEAEKNLEPLVAKLVNIELNGTLSTLTNLAVNSNYARNKQESLYADVGLLIQSFDLGVFQEFEVNRHQYYKLQAIHAGMPRGEHGGDLGNENEEANRNIHRCSQIFNRYEKTAKNYGRWLQKWIAYIDDQYAMHAANYDKIKNRLDNDGQFTSAEEKELIKYQRTLQGFVKLVGMISHPETIERYCRMIGMDSPITQKIVQYKRDLSLWNSHYGSALIAKANAECLSEESPRQVEAGLHIHCDHLNKPMQINDASVNFNAENSELSFAPVNLSYEQKKRVVKNMVSLLIKNVSGNKEAVFNLRGSEQLCQKAAIELFSRGYTHISIHGKEFCVLDSNNWNKLPQILHKALTNKDEKEVEEERLDSTMFHTLV